MKSFPFVKIAACLILSRLLFLLFSIFAPLAITLQDGYLGRELNEAYSSLVWVWANLDGRHYLEIATIGYQKSNFAYFPLYPILISVFGSVTSLDLLYSGIVINLIAFIIATCILYKLTLLDSSKRVARLVIVLAFFFPLSFFYHSVYPDAVFLMLSTFSFYFARKRSWFLSAIFLIFTILTRLSGVALAAAIAWEIVWGKSKTKNDRQINNTVSWGFVSLILAGFGLIPYLVYLQVVHNDWLLFQKSMEAWGQSSIVILPQVIYRYFRILTNVDIRLLVYWIAALEIVTFFLYMLITWYVWRNIRKSYAVFMFLLLIMVTFTGTFAGTPRYMLHLFPGFIAMAMILDRYPILKFVVFLLFVVLGAVLTALFTRGYFIA